MRNDVSSLFMILDGDEKRTAHTAAGYGFEAQSILTPMLPGFSGKNRTVWWFGAAVLLNKMSSQGGKLLYWGTYRFFDTFLRESSKWDSNAAYLWSFWDRTIERGVKRFNGSIGLYMPQDAAGETGTLPSWLGNRFLFEYLKHRLSLQSIPIFSKGKPWPSVREELNLSKGKARITLAMIVKNEEQFLAGCLEQALPYINDIVVVDTGSSDETAKIAGDYNATLITHKWQDDFAAARNAYMKVLPEGFVMSLDADEFLPPESGIFLRVLAERAEQRVYYLNTYNYHSEEFSHHSEQANVRLFYKEADCRYVGRIHEQLATSLPRESFPDSYVLHYGYLPKVRDSKKKEERNTILLDEETMAQGSSFDWYNKGCTMLSYDKPNEALDAFLKYFEIEPEELLVNRPSAFWNAAKAALLTGNLEKAMELAEISCRCRLPEAYFTRAQIFNAMGDKDSAIADYIRASTSSVDEGLYKVYNQIDSSVKMWRASYMAAQLLENAGKLEAAETQYIKAHDGDKGNFFPLLELSRITRKQGKHTDALNWAKKAIFAAKDALDARLEYVESLFALGKLHEAFEFVNKSVSESALFSSLYLTAAGRFRDSGNLRLCIDALGKYIDYHPENVEAVIFYSRLLIEAKEPNFALKALDRNWPYDIDFKIQQEIQIVKGNASYALCDYMDALDSYALAFDLGDKNPELLLKIALTMVKLDRIDDALFALARLKSVDPDYPGGDKAFELVKLKAKLLK